MENIKIYNTLTRKKEPLTTLTEGNIKMYTCGQTVYNHIHMGNARFYVVYDAIRRYLEHRGHNVSYVQNFTDIDDKTIQRAKEEGISTLEIAEKYIASTLTDLQNLNVKPATVNPRVTEEIPEIVAMVQQLVDSNHAYENSGTVYFDVTSFSGYGKLSKKNIDNLEAGARVEVEAGKKNPMDFVLWKPAKPDEPSWPSPWGNGRPGWHIECSAMIRKYLGDQIDIHGGGTDLIFPHHENEIAQSEAVTGKNFANYWMHCGMITVDHKKMSKSRGNFATLQEVAEKFPYDVIRFFFLSVHYRMPMEFTDTVLQAAQQGLSRIKTCLTNLHHKAENAESEPITPTETSLLQEAETFRRNFETAMDDDFNTADAITAIFELVKFANVCMAKDESYTKEFLTRLAEQINDLCEILGIFFILPFSRDIRMSIGAKVTLSVLTKEEVAEREEINALVEARQAAKKAKDFVEADRIRNQLTEMGIVLEDTREGVRWHRA